MLIGQFIMDEKEQMDVAVITECVALFFAKAFFKSHLHLAAPRTDQKFICEVL